MDHQLREIAFINGGDEMHKGLLETNCARGHVRVHLNYFRTFFNFLLKTYMTAPLVYRLRRLSCSPLSPLLMRDAGSSLTQDLQRNLWDLGIITLRQLLICLFTLDTVVINCYYMIWFLGIQNTMYICT